MKIVFLLGISIAASLLLISCADMSRGPATATTSTSMPAGSSPGLTSGGGAGGGGGGFPLKQQP